MKTLRRIFLFAAAIPLVGGRSVTLLVYLLPMLLTIDSRAGGSPVQLDYEVVATREHDTAIFTQGLILRDGLITETSGLYGKSFLVQYRVDSGEVVQRLALPRAIFAEGITEFNGWLYMLTWQAGQAYVFDAQTLRQEAVLPLAGEGWGITHDGRQLITSDGSATLSVRDPTTFAVVRTLQVRDGRQPWSQLNELEYAREIIWANVWQSPKILAISPADGAVTGVVDLTHLVSPNDKFPGRSVLNGIAYDAQQDAFWITGKWWPKRYLVKFIWPADTAQASSEGAAGAGRACSTEPNCPEPTPYNPRAAKPGK